MATFIITKIDNQGDRVLIYGHPKWDDYHVIAEAGTQVKVGDEVEYQPEGVNFGWFVRVLHKTFLTLQHENKRLNC